MAPPHTTGRPSHRPVRGHHFASTVTSRIPPRETGVTPDSANIEQYRIEATISDGSTYHQLPPTGNGVSNAAVWERWELQHEIGSGGQAWVDLEKETATGALRAVKAQSARNFGANPLQKRDLKRELENLISVIGYPDRFTRFLYWYQDTSNVYIAMEYAPYGNLKEYIGSVPGRRSERFAKEVTRQILQGLAVLHQNNICHRDLKPENILVHGTTPLHIKLADLGVSKSFLSSDLVTTTGTTEYQAPEILYRKSPGFVYTNAIDMWSLGCILHNILTEKTPFSDGSGGGINHMSLQQHIAGQPSLFHELMADERFGRSCTELLCKLLDPKAESRVSALAALIDPWLFDFCGALPDDVISKLIRDLHLPRALRARPPLLSAEIRAALVFEYSQRGSPELMECMWGQPGNPCEMYHAASYGYLLVLARLLGMNSNFVPLATLRAAGSLGVLNLLKLLILFQDSVSVSLALQAAQDAGHQHMIQWITTFKLELNRYVDATGDLSNLPGQ